MMNITELFNTFKHKIDWWFKKKCKNYRAANEADALAWQLYLGWNCDWKMNSDDKDIVFEGTKEGIKANTERNRLLEKLENIFVSEQKEGGEPITESLAMCIDKAIITYMKIINCKSENRIKELQKQLDYILINADKLYNDIMSGKKNIITFSHMKDYM